MTTHEFKNDSDQAERRRVQRDTYLARAQAELDEAGGRFKRQTPRLVGAGPPQYPRLPSSSPWASPDPSGDEPPLGIDVKAVPDLGFERCALGADVAPASNAPRLAGVETAASIPSRRRRI